MDEIRIFGMRLPVPAIGAAFGRVDVAAFMDRPLRFLGLLTGFGATGMFVAQTTNEGLKTRDSQDVGVHGVKWKVCCPC